MNSWNAAPGAMPYDAHEPEMRGRRECCADRAVRTSTWGDTEWWSCPVCGFEWSAPHYHDVTGIDPDVPEEVGGTNLTRGLGPDRSGDDGRAVDSPPCAAGNSAGRCVPENPSVVSTRR